MWCISPNEEQLSPVLISSVYSGLVRALEIHLYLASFLWSPSGPLRIYLGILHVAHRNAYVHEQRAQARFEI